MAARETRGSVDGRSIAELECPCSAVDPHLPEELKAERRRQVLALLLGRRFDEGELRSEGIVENVGSKGARMDRA